MNTPKIEAVNIDQRGRLVITLAPAAQGPAGDLLRAKGQTAIEALAKTEEGQTLSKQRVMLSAAQTTATKAAADAEAARGRVNEALAAGESPDASEEALTLATAVETTAKNRIAALRGHIEKSEMLMDQQWETVRQQVVRGFISEANSKFAAAKAEVETIFADNADAIAELAGAVEQQQLASDSTQHSSYLPVSLLKPTKPTAAPAAAPPRLAAEVRPPRPEDFPQPPRCPRCRERGGISNGPKGMQIRCESCDTEIVVPPDHEFAAMLTGAK